MSEKDMNIVCDRCKKKMRGEFDPDEPFKLWYSDREFNAMKRKLTKDLKLADTHCEERIKGIKEHFKKDLDRLENSHWLNQEEISRLEAVTGGQEKTIKGCDKTISELMEMNKKLQTEKKELLEQTRTIYRNCESCRRFLQGGSHLSDYKSEHQAMIAKIAELRKSFMNNEKLGLINKREYLGRMFVLDLILEELKKRLEGGEQ